MTEGLRIPNKNGFYANLQLFNKKEVFKVFFASCIAHCMTIFL